MADAAPTAAALVPAGGALSSAGAGDSLPFSKCAFCFDELAKPTKSREERLDLFKKLLNMYGRANLYPLVRILLHASRWGALSAKGSGLLPPSMHLLLSLP